MNAETMNDEVKATAFTSSFIVSTSSFKFMFLQQPTPTPEQSVTEIAAGVQRALVELVPRVFKGALVLLAFWLIATVGSLTPRRA
jgi:hypothetical protein